MNRQRSLLRHGLWVLVLLSCQALATWQDSLPGAQLLGSGDTAVSAGQLASWQAQMQQSFVDVQAGTRLTGVYLPGQGARFFLGQQMLRDVKDLQFAQAFFAIWLDPRTSNPELRQQLLGVAP